MRRAHSLLELVLAIAVTATLALMALPAVGGWRDRIAVDDAAATVAGAYGDARLVALLHAAPVVLRLDDDAVTVATLEGRDTVTRSRLRGPATLGVAATGLPRTVRLSAQGLPQGAANHTITLARGRAVARVIVSRLGRARLERGP